jgi:tol-pal system protein YbgF
VEELDQRLLVVHSRVRELQSVCGPSAERPTLPVVRLSPEAEAADEEDGALEGRDPEPKAARSFNGGRSEGAGEGSLRRLAAELGPISAEGNAEPRGGQPATARNDPTVIYQEAYNKYAAAQYKRAVRDFEEFLREFPDHEYADNAVFLIGECYLEQKQPRLALIEYKRLLDLYPAGNMAAQALYKVGVCEIQLNQSDQARKHFLRVLEQFPESAAAQEAKAQLQMLRYTGPQR